MATYSASAYRKKVAALLKKVQALPKNRLKRIPRKAAAKKAIPHDGFSHLVEQEIAPGKWHGIARFKMAVDAKIYAHAFHEQYPNVSIRVTK